MKTYELTEAQKEIYQELSLDIPEKIVAQYAEETGDDDLSDIEEAYAGQFDSDRDFAQDMADNLGEMPKDNR